MAKETELLVESQVREDHSVVDLLSTDYTFLNQRLAEHYGIKGIYGNEFRRVKLEDPNRYGLLGQASILAVTSYPNRTAPTIRGKWVLEQLLGTPPPPPPPNVPSLKDDQTTQKLTMRQRMELHRANPACAACHRMMDPLGFALENFDGIGSWRDSTGPGSGPIDSSGTLPDGTPFNGPAGLREVLMKKTGHVRRKLHRAASDLCAGSRRRRVRPRGYSQDRARRFRGQPKVVVHYSWHRQQHSVPNEEG